MEKKPQHTFHGISHVYACFIPKYLTGLSGHKAVTRRGNAPTPTQLHDPDRCNPADQPPLTAPRSPPSPLLLLPRGTATLKRGRLRAQQRTWGFSPLWERAKKVLPRRRALTRPPPHVQTRPGRKQKHARSTAPDVPHRPSPPAISRAQRHSRPGPPQPLAAILRAGSAGRAAVTGAAILGRAEERREAGAAWGGYGRLVPPGACGRAWALAPLFSSGKPLRGCSECGGLAAVSLGSHRACLSRFFPFLTPAQPGQA